MTKIKKTRRKKSKIYWTKEVDDFIVLYNNEEDDMERERIFREHLYAPIDKMVENVINRFKFPYIDGTFHDVKNEVVSFVVMNLHKYDPSKGSKSYSYFSVVAKNYLILNNNKRFKEEKRKVYLSDGEDEDGFSLEEQLIVDPEDEMKINEHSDFIKLFVNYWEFNIENYFKKDRDIEIAYAILTLIKRAKYLDSFNKKAIYVHIREMTNYKSNHITAVIKTMKDTVNEQIAEYKQTGYISDMANYFSIER